MKPGLSGRLLSLEAGLYCLKVHGHAVRDAIEIRAMLTRMIDFLKMKQITSFMTSLVEGGQAQEPIDVGISSLMDTWLLLRMVETNGERKPPIVSSQEQRDGPFQPGARISVKTKESGSSMNRIH